MALALLLILLALVLGGVGLAVTALKWLLIVALVVFVVGLFAGYSGRRTTI